LKRANLRRSPLLKLAHIRRRLAAGWLVWLKEHYPDAEQKDYWKVPYSDVKKQFEESQKQ
jgi:hypothetical protein